MNKDKKTLMILAIVGVALLIIAPLFGMLFDTKKLVNQQGIAIDADSSVSFEDAYAVEFSLDQNEKAVIKFSVYYENVTANLKIFGKGDYDSEVSQNGTNDPINENGKYFMVSQFDWSANPTPNTMRTATCVRDDFYYIEFMGDGDNFGNIWSEPGNYVVLVYGTNSWAGSDDVKFNLVVEVDGAGPVLEIIFALAGWGCIIAVGVVFLIQKKGGIKKDE